MGLYAGSSKVKISSGNVIYHSNLYSSSTSPIVNGILLLSSDNYILKDSKGLYITAKDGE